MHPVTVYRDYLDKEMTIMGVLATFVIGSAAWILKESHGHGVWRDSVLAMTAWSVAMVGAAVCFYLQRSHLAWLYGRLSLAIGRQMDGDITNWIARADTWGAWFWYRTAFVSLGLAAGEYGIALMTAYGPEAVRRSVTDMNEVIVVGVLVAAVVVWVHELRSAYRAWPTDGLDDVPSGVEALVRWRNGRRRGRPRRAVLRAWRKS